LKKARLLLISAKVLVLATAAVFCIYQLLRRTPADQSSLVEQSSSSTETVDITIDETVLIPDEERLIIHEKTVDLDNDGVLEKIVLDAIKADYGLGPGIYNRLRIYELHDRDRYTEKLIFDSEQAGITDFCGEYFDESEDELLIINDYDLNGIPEIYMVEWAFGSTPSLLAILEKNGPQIIVLYLDNMQDFAYDDLDNDGVMELHGITEFGGQVRFNASQHTAFKRQGNTFVPSYDCTRILVDLGLKEAIDIYINKPDYHSTDYVTSMYVLAGDKESLKKFLIDNRYSLASTGFFQVEEVNEVDLLIEQAEEMFAAKAEWLESLKVQ